MSSDSGRRRGGASRALALARDRPRGGRPGRPARARARRRIAPVRVPRLRTERRCGADRGIEGVREGGHGRRRRSVRGAARDRASAVRREGGRARCGEGRLRVSNAGGRRRRVAGVERAAATSSSRSCSKAPRCRSSRSATDVERSPLVSAQDFKRAHDGDEGPNTGGMGAYAPVPGVGATEAQGLVDAVHVPVLAELANRGAPFVGLLYAGLMLTADGPRVLEFNCRFGDPETQAVVPLLDGDLLEVLAAAAGGDVSGVTVGGSGDAAVTVVLATENYPATGDRGGAISGVDARRGHGRARVPCRNCASWRPARDERRSHPRCHRMWIDDRRRACVGIRGGGIHRLPRHALSRGHRCIGGVGSRGRTSGRARELAINPGPPLASTHFRV